MKKIFFNVSKIAFVTMLTLSMTYCKNNAKSYTFTYPVFDSEYGSDVYFDENKKEKTMTEKRYLHKNPSQGELRLYVDELVLGSKSQRIQPIFSLGTNIEFCFVEKQDKKDILYIGLSDNAIFNLQRNTNIQNRIKLFKENIQKNFKNISNIELFIGGKAVNE